jgi:hypothetical protein
MTTKGPDMKGQTPWQPAAAPPPPFAGTVPVSPRKVRPGRAWYLLALAVFLAGGIWLVVGVLGLKGQVDAFHRVPLPQGGLVHLNHSGDYVIYYEAPDAESAHFSFDVSVVPASPGASARSLKPYNAGVTYSFGSRQGQATLTLDISHPGTFRVMATGEPTVTGGSNLAFGPSIAGNLVRTVVIAVPLMLLGIVSGIVLFIVRRVRIARRRA